MESPDIRFYDEGRAKLNNGIANISLDPIFIEAIEQDVGYNVYLTPEARTKGIYVDERASDYFIVKSFTPNSNIAFSWMISTIRKGYKDIRLDLERKENIEIIAVIDNANKVTNVEVINNFDNVQSSNESIVNENTSSSLITGNAVNEITNAEVKEENKFTIYATDEDEIIEELELKTKLEKDKIKKAIKFKHKEPVNEEAEEEIEEEIQIVQQVPQINYMEKVNGSVIIRLG